MGYSLDPLQDGCYENTSVLVNKFDIRDEQQLEMVERNLTGYLMAKAMVEIPFENVDFEFYKRLHRYVFGELYDWAGTIRKVEISKNATRFCPVEAIEKRAKNIFDRLEAQHYLQNFKGETFIDEFVDLYCALNDLHPFREGNGRIQRLFLLMLLKNMGKTIAFHHIDTDLLMIATIKSVSGDVFLLKDIFREHIQSQ